MWIQISSGRGPAECERAVYLFYLKVLDKILKKSGTEYRIIDFTVGETKDSYKSILLHVAEQADLTETLKSFKGSLQWICRSESRPNHGRKNWFFQCEIFQEPESKLFNLKDIELSTLKSGGPGGQHVNKTESAVRAKHIPSGLTVTASEERSQQQNKKLALARILNILETQVQTENNNAMQEAWKSHNQLVRGQPKKIFTGVEFKEKRFTLTLFDRLLLYFFIHILI